MKLQGSADRNSDLSDMRTHVGHMEGTVTRLEDKMDASHSRLEDMVHQLLSALTPNMSNPSPRVGEMSVPAQVLAPTTARTGSQLLPSNNACVDVLTKNVDDGNFEEEFDDDIDAEFVNTLFSKNSTDGRLFELGADDVLKPSAGTDGDKFIDQPRASGGYGTNEERAEIVAVDPEADGDMVEGVDAQEEPQSVQKVKIESRNY